MKQLFKIIVIFLLIGTSVKAQEPVGEPPLFSDGIRVGTSPQAVTTDSIAVIKPDGTIGKSNLQVGAPYYSSLILQDVDDGILTLGDHSNEFDSINISIDNDQAFIQIEGDVYSSYLGTFGTLLVSGGADFYSPDTPQDISQNSYIKRLWKFVNGTPNNISADFNIKNLTVDRFYEYPDEDGTFALQEFLPFSFKDVVLGTANSSSTNAAFREGILGLGEPNPAEQLDVVGSMKTEYTYTNGVKSRMQIGGTNIASELGYPSTAVKGTFIQVLPRLGVQEAIDDMSGKLVMADVSALGGPNPNLVTSLGFGNSTETRFIKSQTARSVTNPLSYFTGFELARDGDKGWVRLYERGLSAGRDQEPYLDIRTEGGNSTATIIMTPHELTTSVNIVKFGDYGSGNRRAGFTNTDDVANTGTVATVLGEPTEIAAWDSNGNFVEAIVNKHYVMTADLFLDDGFTTYTDAPNVSFNCTAGVSYKIELLGQFENVADVNGMAFGFRLSSGTGTINGTATAPLDINESGTNVIKPITFIGSDNSNDRSIYERAGYTQSNEIYPFMGNFIFNCLTDGVFHLTLASESPVNGGTFKAGTGIIVNQLN